MNCDDREKMDQCINKAIISNIFLANIISVIYLFFFFVITSSWGFKFSSHKNNFRGVLFFEIFSVIFLGVFNGILNRYFSYFNNLITFVSDFYSNKKLM